jgi:hypothetical protein
MLRRLCAGVLAGIAFHCCSALAEDSLTLRTDLPPALAQRLVKEAQDRAACKKVICEAARLKKADGDAITCSVLKTWPAQDLRDKILRGKLEWKLGHAQCKADIKLDRSVVARVLSEPKFEMKVG